MVGANPFSVLRRDSALITAERRRALDSGISARGRGPRRRPSRSTVVVLRRGSRSLKAWRLVRAHVIGVSRSGGGGGGSPGALRLRVRAGQPRAALPPTSRPPRVGGSFPRGPSQVLLSLVVRLFVHWPHASPSEAILARGSVTWLWAPAPARDRVTKARTDRRTDRRHRCRRSGPRPQRAPGLRPPVGPRRARLCHLAASRSVGACVVLH